MSQNGSESQISGHNETQLNEMQRNMIDADYAQAKLNLNPSEYSFAESLVEILNVDFFIRN
jgi:hypothetical protein